MHTGGSLEPCGEIVRVIGPHVLPLTLLSFLGDPVLLTSPTPRRHEYERGSFGIEIAGVARPFRIVGIGLALNLSVHAKFPDRDTVGDVRVTLWGFDETIPTTHLDTLVSRKLDPADPCYRCKDELADDARQFQLGDSLVRPPGEIRPVGERRERRSYPSYLHVPPVYIRAEERDDRSPEQLREAVQLEAGYFPFVVFNRRDGGTRNAEVRGNSSL